MNKAEQLIETAQRVIHRHGGDFSDVPLFIRQIWEGRLWEGRTDRSGQPFRNMREFVETPIRDGLGLPWDKLKAIAKVSDDAELEVILREGALLPSGDRSDLSNNIREVKATTGTSRDYTLTRLKRDHAKLYDRVKGGELSANAAAIEAGFRKKLSRVERAQKEWEKMTAQERKEFLRWIKSA